MINLVFNVELTREFVKHIIPRRHDDHLLNLSKSALFGEETMKANLQKVIYWGTWRGLGKMSNIKVENGYTTIIVKHGPDLKQRAKETSEKFVGKTWASVLALWGLGLFCALSAFSQTKFAVAPTVSFTVPANASTGVASAGMSPPGAGLN